MFRLGLRLSTAMLALSGLVAAAAPAHAAADILEGVTFSDGGSATGSFTFTPYSYLATVNIVTTDGLSAPTQGSLLPGFSYASGTLLPNSPPASAFNFTSIASDPHWALVLDLTSALGYHSYGFDTLIAGSVSGSTLSGSYEVCVYGCTGFASGSYRLITGGEVYAVEPASLTLLGVGALLLPAVRRRFPARRGVA